MSFLVESLTFVLEWFKSGIGSYGYSIIILTILLRLLLAPLNIRQLKTSGIMNRVSDEVAASIKDLGEVTREERIKARMQAREELLKKYDLKSGGCFFSIINMSIQVFVLVSFFLVIKNSSKIASEKFLWFELGRADRTLIIPLLTVGIYMLYFYINSRTMKSKKFGLIFGGVICLILLLSAFSIPSVLYLYWLTSNIILIFIMLYVQFSLRKVPLQKN